MNSQEFEDILSTACVKLTGECQNSEPFSQSKVFENRVREVIGDDLKQFGFAIDFSPHPFGFPDIVIGDFGVEVKFTTNDSWRSVANSVFEGYRNRSVRHIYLIFGKMGGIPSVRWARYEECVMHVRTSHVPRFEVDMDASESLFEKFGISYDEFSELTEEGRMEHIRRYARTRLKAGERLWWLEPENEGLHSLPIQVRLFANLSPEEKLQMRAEASLLCPQIVGSSRNRTKYVDAIMYLLTYHGVLSSRDAFSAGSVAGAERGGNYVLRALQNIESQMRGAAARLEDRLFLEYWGEIVASENRISHWLTLADQYAALANPPWKPSEHLFLSF